MRTADGHVACRIILGTKVAYVSILWGDRETETETERERERERIRTRASKYKIVSNAARITPATFHLADCCRGSV